MIKKTEFAGNIFNKKTVFTFDSEAFKKNISNKEELQTLYIGNIYSDNENYYFYSLQDFLRIVIALTEKYKNLLFIAHNLKYDLKLIGLLDLFIAENEFIGFDCVKKIFGNVNYFKFKSKRQTIEFLDSTNYVKLPLSEIGEKMFGMEKWAHNEYQFNGEKWNTYIKTNGKELVLQDCKILYQFCKFLQDYKEIKYGISASQSAFKTWNYKFNPENVIDLDKYNLIANEIYHGGRTEIYERNIKNEYISLDINSLYPFAMRNFKYSIKFRKRFNVIGEDEIKYLIENIQNQNYNYILFIDYKTALKRTPIMSKKSGSLIDLQENMCWITGQEFLLLYQSDKDLVFRIYNCLEFYNAELFTEYIDYFYAIKKNAKNEIEKAMAKIMLNGLYGKMGQKNKHIEIEPYTNYPELEAFKNDCDRMEFNGKMYSLYENFLTYNVEGEYKYAPIISAEITANARCENYRWQIKLGIENVKSTDTDSFFIPIDVFENYPEEFLNEIIGNELGQLKIEFDKSGIIQFYGLKDYQNYSLKFRKTKGIRKGSKIIGKNKYEVKIFSILNKSKEIGVIVEKRIKQLKYEKTKLDFATNYGKIYKNEEEYYKANNINIPENDNCIRKK